MFECKYKLELNDCLVSAKYVYKSQKRKQDKVIAILIPILMIAMVGMLIYDIYKNRAIVWDIVLLVALLILEVLYIVSPIMLIQSQKKSFKTQNLAEMDLLHIKIDDKLCVETLLKDEKEMAKNIHNLKHLTSYIEDKDRLILVFNNIEFVCLRKQYIVGDLNKLKQHLEKSMSKTSQKKR